MIDLDLDSFNIFNNTRVVYNLVNVQLSVFQNHNCKQCWLAGNCLFVGVFDYFVLCSKHKTITVQTTKFVNRSLL